MSKMRNNILKLIKSGITAHQVAADTGLPRNTVYRIFSGETKLDNVKFSTTEILNKYYIEEVWIKMNIESLDQAIADFNEWGKGARIYLDTTDGYFSADVYHNDAQMSQSITDESFVAVYEKDEIRGQLRIAEKLKAYIVKYARLVLDGWEPLQAEDHLVNEFA